MAILGSFISISSYDDWTTITKKIEVIFKEVVMGVMTAM